MFASPCARMFQWVTFQFFRFDVEAVHIFSGEKPLNTTKMQLIFHLAIYFPRVRFSPSPFLWPSVAPPLSFPLFDRCDRFYSVIPRWSICTLYIHISLSIAFLPISIEKRLFFRSIWWTRCSRNIHATVNEKKKKMENQLPRERKKNRSYENEIYRMQKHTNAPM